MGRGMATKAKGGGGGVGDWPWLKGAGQRMGGSSAVALVARMGGGLTPGAGALLHEPHRSLSICSCGMYTFSAPWKNELQVPLQSPD